ncbi:MULTISPECIES: hypothetical protein [Cysteiniphilum]|uniref:Uncharacterized protein n=1 Tax=Cysteiniphilum litorale TaxID=2056700 RepID=A0A8J3E9S3_9GAMM|nr:MULTISPECIES: hypothetical protein [Cysteiniphilum]GGG05783.1 hypothetical protein GCM10010995_24120 [Cysteiniphilum litorale]
MKEKSTLGEIIVLILGSISTLIALIATGSMCYMLYNMISIQNIVNKSQSGELPQKYGLTFTFTAFKINNEIPINVLANQIGVALFDSSAGLIMTGYDNAIDKLAKMENTVELGKSISGIIKFTKNKPQVLNIPDISHPKYNLAKMVTYYKGQNDIYIDLTLNIAKYSKMSNGADNEVKFANLLNDPNEIFLYQKKSNYSVVVLLKFYPISGNVE